MGEAAIFLFQKMRRGAYELHHNRGRGGEVRLGFPDHVFTRAGEILRRAKA